MYIGAGWWRYTPSTSTPLKARGGLGTSHNTPDVCFVDTRHKEVLMVEVGCVFDLYMGQAFQEKYLQYQPLLQIITTFGYTCRYSVLIFGSLGHVHKCTTRGLRIAGMARKKAKQVAKYCSVSAIIGSLAVWRRRCYVYP